MKTGAFSWGGAALLMALIAGCSKPNEPASVTPATSDTVIPMQQLEQRLQTIEDREAVLRLQRAYGFYTSKGDWDRVADLFGDDARFVRGADDISGREAIRAYLKADPLIGDGIGDGVMAEEYQLQPVIQVDGENATGRWRTWIMRGTQGVDAYWGDGIYSADYRKVDGRWVIDALRWDETFVVPYKGGWSSHASVNAGGDIAGWPQRKIVDYRYSSDDIAAVTPQPDQPTHDQWRVHYLEDAAAIENLLSAHGYYLSDFDFAGAASLYAEQGTAEIGQRGVFRGRERIEQILRHEASLGIGDGVLNNHIDIQAVIHVAPDRSRAWSRSRTMLQLGKFEDAGMWGDAVVENEYVLENDRWRIASHRFYPTFISDYDKGFVGGAMALGGPSDELPPDAPPTEQYQSLPEAYTPPFHYVHPVSGRPFDDRPAAVTTTGATRPPVSGEPSALDARITRLEDILEITNLQRSYGYIVDKALWKETSELFSADGTLEIGGRGIFQSPARIHEYYGFLGAEGPVYGRLINHIQMQPLVTVDDGGQTASLHAHFWAQGGDLPSKKVAAEDAKGVQTISYIGTGWYDNRYRKEDGVWKLETLYGLFRMYTFEDKGWGEFSLPNTKLEEKMPPDHPPTQVYKIFPDTFFPVEHFDHPVTGRAPG